MKKNILKRFFVYIKPYWTYAAIGFLCAIAGIALSLYAPVVSGRAIDKIIGKGNVNFSGIFGDLLVFLVAMVLSAAFQWGLSFCANKVTYGTIKGLRDDAFKKLGRLPLRHIDSNPHGDIISRVTNDTDQLSDGLLQFFTQFFTGSVTILGTLAFMFSVNYIVAFVVVLLTPLSLFAASFIARHSFKMFSEQSAIKGELSGCAEEMIGGLKTVKAFCHEEKAAEKFDGINARLHKCGIRAQFYSSLTNPSTRLINGFVYAATGVAGALLAINGRMSIGQISCFLSYAGQYTKPFNEITAVITEMQNAFACAERVFALLDAQEETDDGGEEIKSCEGRVEFSNVNFSYDAKKQIIKDFSLSARPGERVAIVGPTGCGKTTLINLLMRFYETSSGEIKIDGKDIKSLSKNNLRRLFGMVLQDTWLFSGTIRENIAYGKEDASFEEIVEAAKKAHAHGFIKRLEKGYDTVVSDDGGNISQGQRQLLCIARAMLAMPPMLILDEATSSIDTRTEISVQKAFSEIMRGRTSFVVAHRLSTIKEADTIIVMRSGRIAEKGTHDELLEKGGFYAKLYKSQFGGE
jgi:ATP-binding cassette subfamily B protein